MNALEKWVLQEMVEHLEEMEGQVVYGCDLAFKLFEYENYVGSYTCNSYSSNQWIREYWDFLGEEVEEYKYMIGESPNNCFDNPEVFQIQIILSMASRLVSNSDFVEDNWNEEIEFTADVIKKIVSEWKACY